MIFYNSVTINNHMIKKMIINLNQTVKIAVETDCYNSQHLNQKCHICIHQSIRPVATDWV